MSNWHDLKSGGFSPELNPLWLSCSPGREAHCSDLYCRQRCKTETWGTLKVLRFRHLVCNILLLLVVIDFDRIDVEVFTDPGKASEQYPGNPGHVVSAEDGEANNNKADATANTRAIFLEGKVKGANIYIFVSHSWFFLYMVQLSMDLNKKWLWDKSHVAYTILWPHTVLGN